MRAAGFIAFLIAASCSAFAHAQAQAISPAAILAAYRQSTGGDGWDRLAGLDLEGSVEIAGSHGTFREVIDHRRGYFRREIHTGPLDDLSGFDGAPWVAQNGVVTSIDLPGFLSDARSQAYVRRDGWWGREALATLAHAHPAASGCADIVMASPQAGSSVEAWFDQATHLLARTVIHADGGDLTTVFSDWRWVGGVQIAFTREEIDSNGDRTVFSVKTASIIPTEVEPSRLARPVTRQHGSLPAGQPVTVKFRFDATDHGHIVVPAKIDDKDATLIFDTGAAGTGGADLPRTLVEAKLAQMDHRSQR